MLTNYVNNLSNLVNQFVPIYQTILDTINNPNEISNIYQLLDNITEELNANGNECELEFMANNKFILTTYTGNGNCIINVMPGGANISCSVGICGTANLLYNLQRPRQRTAAGCTDNCLLPPAGSAPAQNVPVCPYIPVP